MRHTEAELKAKIEAMEARRSLADSDRNMARIGEDLIEILISKGVITAEDLPGNVKEKIDKRKELREKL